MAFRPIMPEAKPNKAYDVTASTRLRTTTGTLVLKVGVSEVFLRKVAPIGQEFRLKVEYDDAVRQLLVTFSDDGVFLFKVRGYGGLSIALPAFDGMVVSDGKKVCQVVGQLVKLFTVQLPESLYDRSPRRWTSPRAEAQPTGVELAAQTDRIDVVKYLKLKGVHVERVDWIIDGVAKATTEEALKIVNDHRKREELPPVTAGQLA